MPSYFPALPAEWSGPRSEYKFLQRLQQLTEPYQVFWQLQFLWEQPQQQAKPRLRQGEIDVVLLHPRWGLLVLEVKGGGISLQERQWWSKNDKGMYAITDPFEQARRNMQLLRKRCEALGLGQIPCGYGVVFPDCVLPAQTALPLEATPQLIFDQQDLQPDGPLEARLLELQRRWLPNPDMQAPSRNALQELRQRVLAPSFRLVPTYAVQQQEAEQRWLQLTEQQFQVLDLLEQQPQFVIQGGAGTGKTLLAVEKSRRLAEAGAKVLLLCFNEPLAEYLRQQTEGRTITARHFHGFAEETCRAVGLPWELPTDPGELLAFYHETAPELLLQACELGTPRFDALVVDEGQDFLEAWWLPLLELLPQVPSLYVFLDPRQDLYQVQSSPPVSLPPFVLQENCRNSRQITEWLGQTFEDGLRPKLGSPEGVPPVLASWSTQEEQITLVKETLRQLQKERVPPRDICVLSPYSVQRSQLVKALEQEPLAQGVARHSIMRFKGLEAPCVLLVDVGSSSFASRQDLLYVGASRAKSRLWVFSKPSKAPSGA